MNIILLFKNFYLGIVESMYSILILSDIYENKQLRNHYNNLLFYNIFINILYTYLITSCIEYYSVIITTKYHYYILTTLKFMLWILPNYLISLVHNGYYTNEIVKTYIENNKSENVNLGYNCYEKYSLYLINKCYYQIIVIMLMFETVLVSNIKYIGKYIDMFCSSLIYSYYCWEYCWSSYKIPHNNRYSIFESNWSYYLGYGFIMSVIKLNFSYLNANYIIGTIFPLFTINTLNFYCKEKLDITENALKLPLFTIPIKYANYIVSKISNYLMKNKK